MLPLGLLLIVVVVGFTILGLWQLNVARGDSSGPAQPWEGQDPVAVTSVIRPHEAFPNGDTGRLVSVTGTYASDRQFLVPERLLDDREGLWVATPLVEESTGATIIVMRGWVAEPSQADAPDGEKVTVTGTLMPGEAAVPGEWPQGQRGSIDLAALVNEWPDELFNGFVFSMSEEPKVTASQVRHVPPPPVAVEDIDWRSLGYSLQWWVFAAFAVWMYLKFLRAEAERLGYRRSKTPRASVSSAGGESKA